MKIFIVLFSLVSSLHLFSQGIVLPPEFEDVTILTNLQDPSTIAFSPDGSLFYSERISGELRKAEFDNATMSWSILPEPFYTFDVPTEEHRSSGLRGITFDPDFEENGYVYAFYMKNNPRHNRVVRIQADPNNPDIALADELLILDLPFNSSSSSGSHNGGDLSFGLDSMLYFTTGDGWNGGDNVQSLSTFTGKVFRINPDGEIPEDNPFYDTASDNYRAIYALGLRNPYTMASSPESQNLYINDAVGSAKATVYRLLADNSDADANFGHDGYDGIGTSTGQWANTGIGSAKLITGGAWYPINGYWPIEYHGSYLAAMWGPNNTTPGDIVQLNSESNTTVSLFATGVMVPPRNKPVMTKIGPDDNLYYLLTDYETGTGQINMIRYTGQPVVSSPIFTPAPGQYLDSIYVEITSLTDSVDIYFTLDGTNPDSTSTAFSDSVLISTNTTLKAIAYADTLLPSAIANGEYIIGPILNIPPVANAGPELIVKVGQIATLNGANSYDPDGSQLEIMESWKQIDGPPTVLLDDDETVSNFTPLLSGTYTFQILIQDVDGALDSATTRITAIKELPDIFEGLIARWSCENGLDTLIEDTSPNSNQGILNGAIWDYETADASDYSIAFDGMDDLIDLGNLDISGTEMTICFWTKIQSFSTHDARFISKASGQYDVDHKWMISTLNDTKLRFRLNTDVGGTVTLISDANVLELDTWTHVAATYNGDEMKIYKDGLLIESEAKTGNIATDPSVNAAIGNQPLSATGGARPFNGMMDEIRIYGTALTAAQLDTIRLAAVEKCNDTVQNLLDDGNGTFRRSIACAESLDTIQFDILNDSIIISSSPIEINNSLRIEGLDSYEPMIYNNLMEPALHISTLTNVEFYKLNLQTDFGPLILNAGNLTLDSVQIHSPINLITPPFQNTGQATIKGKSSIKID